MENKKTLEIKVDINDSFTPLESAYCEGPFDEAKEVLEKNSYRIISLEQIAQLRVYHGLGAEISKKWSFTREGFLYDPNKGIFLTKNSPIMKNTREAVECARSHRYHQHSCLTNEQVEEALADSIKITKIEIPSLRLSEEELTAYAFGKQAKDYGEFMKRAGIDTLNVRLLDVGETPFVMPVYIRGLEGGPNSDSGLLGYAGNLADDGCEARGVRERQR